jgi:DNA polymerase-3 subunit beta
MMTATIDGGTAVADRPVTQPKTQREPGSSKRSVARAARKGLRIEMLQEHLGEALGVVSRVVPTKGALPVLANVLLATEGAELALTGTNLELAIRHRVAVDVLQPGEITLPAKLLSDYVALLAKGEKATLNLNLKTFKVGVECGRFKADISGMDAVQFPPVPSVDEDATSFTIPAATLRNALRQVSFSASSSDDRPVLAGVCLRVEDGVKGATLTLVAADGFRLALRKLDLDDGATPMTMIVPATALAEVVRLLPDTEGASVTVTKSGTNVRFAFGKTEVTSRLIEGQFPDWMRIMPAVASANSTITMSVADAVRATRAATVFARDNANAVRLSGVKGTDEIGQVRVTSRSMENGDVEGEVDAVVDGAEMSIAFNGKYLRDALEAIQTDNVVLYLTAGGAPGLFRPAGTTEDVAYVVMPMHVAAVDAEGEADEPTGDDAQDADAKADADANAAAEAAANADADADAKADADANAAAEAAANADDGDEAE